MRPYQTRRVQLELGPDAMGRLERLKHEIEASTYAEVMKNALTAYEWLIKERRAGHNIYSEPRDGDRARVIVI